MSEDEWQKQDSADIWLPKEKGKELVGEVVSIVEGAYGNQHVIKQEDGSELRTPSHKVLQNRMARVKVEDIVKIVYTGEELPTVKGNNATQMYEVFVKKQ